MNDEKLYIKINKKRFFVFKYAPPTPSPASQGLRQFLRPNGPLPYDLRLVYLFICCLGTKS